MASSAPQTIICGVTCACAQEQKDQARPTSSSTEPSIISDNCVAQDSCPHAKDGTCSCKGFCQSSQNKKTCSLAVEGNCDCAAGACKKMEAARKDCPNCPGCDCAAGECKAAKIPLQ